MCVDSPVKVGEEGGGHVCPPVVVAEDEHAVCDWPRKAEGECVCVCPQTTSYKGGGVRVDVSSDSPAAFAALSVEKLH